MTRLVLLAFAAVLSASAFAAPAATSSREAPAQARIAAVFRAPALAPALAVALPAPSQKRAAPQTTADGPMRVGFTRDLEKSAALETWTRVPGGYAMRFTASSEGAQGLRARLDVGAMPGPFEVRAQGTDGRIETMSVDPASGPRAWTPWTAGATQLIEVFTPWLPPAGALRLGSLVHFTDSPLAKAAAGSCTLPTMCAPTDAALSPDQVAAIAQAKQAVMRIQYVDQGSAFVCTATLVNTEKYPAPYILTANHCVNNAQSAASITAYWFYEALACNAAPDLLPVQIPGGMQLVFTNYNVDETLLQANAAPPEGAIYAGLDATRLTNGEPIVSISHPKGDTTRYAIGSTIGEYRILGRPEDQYGVHFSEGIIEGGSSGSALFTLSNGSLVLRGVLTGTTVRQPGGMSCTDLNEDALYSRLEVFYPEIASYVTNAGKASDDAPNRVQDFAGIPLDLNGADKPLDTAGGTVARDGKRIDYAGDVDLYRFTLNTTSWVSAWTESDNLDTVGNILDARGVNIVSNDDANTANNNNNAGVTVKLQAGTYYFQVQHWQPAGTGAYNVRLRADHLDDNYTDLWWNPAESGWGININHQDNTLFATLFTYDANGAPMWLVMSDGARLGPGSYQGTLYRTTGSAFNAAPFTGASAAPVGTLRLDFADAMHGTLSYTVNGTAVTKSITRQVFSTAPSCTWSAFDRGFSDNYQDLWWNPAESGWGVNLTHQGSILFATLFTYDANGQGLWLVMSNGAQVSDGKFSGPLYRTTGPAFNASPWTAATAQPVGTMTVTFTDGDNGTLTYTYNGISVTKAITRQVFGQVRTDCGPQDS